MSVDAVIDVLAGVMVLAGSAFALIAGLGVVRLGDVFQRMHASTKAGTLGLGLVVLALALQVESETARTKAILVLAFLLLTAPVGAHLVGRAVYRSMSQGERERCRPEPRDAD